jgi:hypothetical protein
MSGTTGPSWRALHLDGVGAVEVRRPTLRDIAGASDKDPAWWHGCVRIDGQPLTRDQCLDLEADIANALAQEVAKPRSHPSQAPSDGCGA